MDTNVEVVPDRFGSLARSDTERQRKREQIDELQERFLSLNGDPATLDEKVDTVLRMARLIEEIEDECFWRDDLGGVFRTNAFDRERVVRELVGAPSVRENFDGSRSACENADTSKPPALVRTFAGEQGDDDGKDPRACENVDFSRCLDRYEEGQGEGEEEDSSLISVRENSVRENRPRGDRSSADFLFEQRIWTSSIMASPFASRKSVLPRFTATFGLKRATFDRRLAEIREGWRPPFRRGS